MNDLKFLGLPIKVIEGIEKPFLVPSRKNNETLEDWVKRWVFIENV